MKHVVDDPEDSIRRKQSRASRARGRAGHRRLEAILEAANIVVQRVDTENDIGRDAFVDIVDGTDVTGGVICVQVKSGPSHFHNGQWVVPGEAADFTLWRESTVPFFGVVHDPEDDALMWVDLSQAAMLAIDKYLSPVVSGPYSKPSMPVPAENRLDLDIAPFIEEAKTALRRRSGSPAVNLLSDDPDAVEVGIVDTFAVGRHDPTAFLLLAALFHRLPKECRRLAVVALAMTTSHPDVGWTKDNWIPDRVTRTVRERCRWTSGDVTALLGEIDEDSIDRGTIGQTVFHVLTLDRDLQPKLFTAALDRSLPDSTRFHAAVILLYLAGEAAPGVVDRLLESDRAFGTDDGLFPASKGLLDVDHFEYLIQSVADFGYISLF